MFAAIVLAAAVLGAFLLPGDINPFRHRTAAKEEIGVPVGVPETSPSPPPQAINTAPVVANQPTTDTAASPAANQAPSPELSRNKPQMLTSSRLQLLRIRQRQARTPQHLGRKALLKPRIPHQRPATAGLNRNPPLPVRQLRPAKRKALLQRQSARVPRRITASGDVPRVRCAPGLLALRLMED